GTEVAGEKTFRYSNNTKHHQIFLFLAPLPPQAEEAPDGPPTPAPRHKGTLAHMTAPRPPSFNEADVSNKPSHIQKRPLLNAEQSASLITSTGPVWSPCWP